MMIRLGRKPQPGDFMVETIHSVRTCRWFIVVDVRPLIFGWNVRYLIKTFSAGTMFGNETWFSRVPDGWTLVNDE